MLRFTIILTFLITSIAGSSQLPFGSFKDEFVSAPILIDDGIVSSDDKRFLSEDSKGVLWIASNRGVLRYDGKLCINVSKYLKGKYPDELRSDQENTVFVDSLDQVWLGGQKGLALYDLHTNQYKTVFLDFPLHKANLRNQVKRILQYGDQIYVCTNNGLYVLDIDEHKVVKSYLTVGELQKDRHNTHHAIQGVYPTINDSLIYIQANDGMHIINKHSGEDKIIKTSKLAKSKYWGDNKHWIYQGAVVDDVIISSSYNTGIVHFDIKNEEYDVFLPDPSRKLTPNRNIFKSLTAFNDSTFILTGAARGLYIYEYPSRRLSKVKNAPHIGNWGLIDSHGYYWAGKWGELFRSSRPLSNPSNKYRSLQLSQAFSKKEHLAYPSFESLEEIALREDQDHFKLLLSITHAMGKEEAACFQYKLCKSEWKDINAPYLELNDLPRGRHSLNIRAEINGSLVEEKTIILDKHCPWYKIWYYQLLVLSMFIGLIYIISQYRINVALKAERLKTDYELKIAQLNTTALRSRMNPHFLFNTLNSIKHHALIKSKEETSSYITEFSQIIRGILEYSHLEYLNLHDDIEWVKSYINIEQKRFREPFLFDLRIDPNLDLETEKIPPLFIQPYIENAIWHGLYHKTNDKRLILYYTKIEDGYKVIIEDNGIGRLAAQEYVNKGSKKNSLGMKITKDRITQMNQLNKYLVTSKVVDLKDKQGYPLGTKLILSFKHKT